MTIGPTNGFDEYMNSEKSYDPNLKPDITNYEVYKELFDKGVYVDRFTQAYMAQMAKQKEEGRETYADGYELVMRLGKKEMIEQDKKLLEKEIAEYLLEEYDKYSEEEKVNYSWKEFFEVFVLIIYTVFILILMCHVPIIWQLILFGVIVLSGIAYSKVKKHYKNQKEIDDLLCQLGVASMKNKYQEEEILYQQLVEKGIF